MLWWTDPSLSGYTSVVVPPAVPMVLAIGSIVVEPPSSSAMKLLSSLSE
jgi:hypothetical protein